MSLWVATSCNRDLLLEAEADGLVRINLHPSARKIELRRKFVFQQDTDPKLAARATLEQLNPKEKLKDVLEWPSLEIYLIRNLWQDLQIAASSATAKYYPFFFY